MAKPSLRVAFFGTPQVAVPTLEALVDSPHEVVVVVSQPDRGRGRGRKSSPSPVSERALAKSLPLIRPERVGDPEAIATLAGARPDIGVVVAFGQFLPKGVRTLPSVGYLINAHASLLPRYRGASPIAQAILDGEPRTGVSVMRVEREMDTGAVGLVKETEIGPEENTAELTERLSLLAAEAIVEALDAIADDTITWREQDHAHATLAPKIAKADGRVVWTRPARELVRFVHGMAPRPGAFSELPTATESKDGATDVLRILRAGVDERAADDPPGTIRLGREAGDPPLRVATGAGWLVPREVQRAGGRAMATDAFLRGHAVADGARFVSGEPSTGDAEAATPPGATSEPK